MIDPPRREILRWSAPPRIPPRLAGRCFRRELPHPRSESYDKRMAADYRDVDPADLRLPPSRSSGADPYKLQQQIARFGSSTAGMPPVLVYEGSDGVLEIIDGATRDPRRRARPGSHDPRRGAGQAPTARRQQS